MINGKLTHPDVLRALASAGHTAKVLIADGHFPSSTALPQHVARVVLNYAPDVISAPAALGPILDAVPVQAAVATVREDGSKPPAWAEFDHLLPADIELESVKGSELTTTFSEQDLCLAILTGDLRPASCIVLTLGLRQK
ncbi:MAG: RbsD/FucU domain-containing protein [Propionicimonas sp.]|nr:RbsD/FucU domain-containing protein [Propionicimonas sp.]